MFESELRSGGAEYGKFSEWIHTHTNGWEHSYVSFAPKTVIRGQNFSLNFLPGMVVLNQWGNLRPTGQFVLRIHDGDPSFLNFQKQEDSLSPQRTNEGGLQSRQSAD